MKQLLTLPLLALFLASCVSIERNNPDDPGSIYFGRGNAPVGSCAGFAEGTEREHYGKSKAQFCDARDGKKYVYVEIGTQTWMAENLNYNASGSKCYNNQESNCTAYGRLYGWYTAKAVCPSGWRLPNDDDWDALMMFYNPYYSGRTEEGMCALGICADAGTKLRAASGWYLPSGIPNGTDDNGFSALPGGYSNSDGDFYIGETGRWWSASEYNANEANNGFIWNKYGEDFVYGENDKSGLYSVRCVQGDPPSSSNLVCTPEDNNDYYYCSNGTAMKKYGSVTDKDGQNYKTVVIGTQTWMAENLNYNAESIFTIGSYCYNEDEDFCELYGRLYDYATALTACPIGWHLPSDAEWTTLEKS